MEKYEGKLIEDQEQDSFLSYSSKGLNTIERIKKNGIDYFPDKNYCDKIVIKINVRDSDLSQKLTRELFRCYQDLREIITYNYMLPEIKEMVNEKGRLLVKVKETNKESKMYNTFKLEEVNVDKEKQVLGRNAHDFSLKNLCEKNKLDYKNEDIKDIKKIKLATEFYRLVCENRLLLDFTKNYFHAYYTQSNDFMLRLFSLLEESKKSLNEASIMIDAVQNFSDPDEVAKMDIDEDSED